MAEPTDVVKLPSFDEDKRAMATASPGWLGVVYVPVNRDRRKHLSIPDGAVQITSVLPRSPAALAGLRTGDIVVAAGGRPLVHSRALRPLIAAATLNAALRIEVLRGASHMILTPVVGLAPRPKARN
jgi:S1-C subfamily serine protease